MRNPSIHIDRHQFEEILDYLQISNFPTDAFFIMARKKAINHRAVVVTNDKINKRVSNILLASQGDAALVADIIYATRIKLKHKGVRKINETNSRDWANCKKLAEICNTFCQDFDLQTREGFIKYIETGISRMSDHKNLIQRLISMQENITEDYQAQLELSQLSRSELEQVTNIKEYFYKQIADSTGIYERDEKADKLIHFYNLKRLCDRNNWDYEEFIDSQFESLAWCNGIPNIRELSNEKAIERYNKYKYRMKGKTKIDQDEETSIWDKMKKEE